MKICSVYRSSQKEGAYLYVLKADELSKVPEALLAQFGTPVHAMVLVLTPEKKLARVDTGRVLAALDKDGFFLQLPPPPEDADQVMRDIHQKNSKL